MTPTTREQREFLLKELERAPQSSWDWEADFKFAQFLGETEAADVIEACMNSGGVTPLRVGVFQLYGKRIKELRLKRLRELQKQGFVQTYWQGTGFRGKTDYGVSRVTVYEKKNP